MISIVTSMYNSAPYLNEFIQRHLTVVEALNVDYEFIFVDDASPDNSVEILRRLMKSQKNVKLIRLSRNFGQHVAMFAGMSHASGDLIYALDADLEEAPENLSLMYQTLIKDSEIDVVYGVLKNRTGNFMRNFMGKIFYRLMDFLSEVKIPHDQAWQRIMRKSYVESLLLFTERESLPAGIMVLNGFNQKPLVIEKPYKGHSSYSFSKRMKLAINSIISFSSRPLVLIGIAGIIITLISALAILVTISMKISNYDFQAGWVSLLSSVWLLGGMILTSIGVTGIYVAKIFNQVKGRPLFIVRNIESS